ncbi:MAG: hypothetical protein V4679_21120 [Pseudomonadota bacterium]
MTPAASSIDKAVQGRRPLKLRLLLTLYSNGNIAGCALALLGPVLLFAGAIGPGWLPITAALYAAGWLLGWGSRQAPHIERRIEDTLTIEETLTRLDTLAAGVAPHLTADMNGHLRSVRSCVAEVLPRLLGERSSHHDANLFTVRETVLRYLPETLANYVALPPAFRTTHVLTDGKTARQILADQLALLDGKMREIVANVAGADAQALLANGKFLEMKFQQPDFLAGIG